MQPWVAFLGLPDSALPWVGVGTLLHLVCFILVVIDCMRHRRDANSALLWFFICWSFPVVGAMFYLGFGVYRSPAKTFKKRVTNERLLAERRAREDEALPLAYWRAVHEAVRGEPREELARELNRNFSTILPEHDLLGGNAITSLVTGQEAFPRMLETIRRARHHVHLQSFIIGNDAIGRECMDVLERKAQEGVKVRLLYDRFGSSYAVWGGLFDRYCVHPNFQISGWTQANPLKRQFQVNLRNHRKILVVDGEVAFTGGINLHDENVPHGGEPPIRDYHFMLRGPVVQELQYTFMRDWYFMTDEDPAELLRESYFPHLAPAGPAMIRVVNSGPAGSEMEALSDVLFMAIVSARKQILAVTPYFVPPHEIVRGLRAAAQKGVDVRLIVPRKNNHVYAGMAGRARYEELLEAGVRVFERQEPFIHAKALIIDDTLAVVGSANMDMRSFRLNYETNLLVFDDRFLNELKRIVLDDLARSEELDLAEWRRRPVCRQMLENLCYLMMPVL